MTCQPVWATDPTDVCHWLPRASSQALASLTPSSHPALRSAALQLHLAQAKTQEKTRPEGQRGTQYQFISHEFIGSQHRANGKSADGWGEGEGLRSCLLSSCLSTGTQRAVNLRSCGLTVLQAEPERRAGGGKTPSCRSGLVTKGWGNLGLSGMKSPLLPGQSPAPPHLAS